MYTSICVCWLPRREWEDGCTPCINLYDKIWLWKCRSDLNARVHVIFEVFLLWGITYHFITFQFHTKSHTSLSLSLSLSPTNKPVWFVSADGMVISNKRVSQSMAAVYMYIVRNSLEGAGCEQEETWKESVSSVSGSGPKSSRAH